MYLRESIQFDILRKIIANIFCYGVQILLKQLFFFLHFFMLYKQFMFGVKILVLLL